MIDAVLLVDHEALLETGGLAMQKRLL